MMNTPTKKKAAGRATAETIERLNRLKTPKVAVSGKIYPKDKDALKKHFDEIGLSLSAGVSMVLKTYMRDNGIS